MAFRSSLNFDPYRGPEENRTAGGLAFDLTRQNTGPQMGSFSKATDIVDGLRDQEDRFDKKAVADYFEQDKDIDMGKKIFNMKAEEQRRANERTKTGGFIQAGLGLAKLGLSFAAPGAGPAMAALSGVTSFM